MAETPTNPDGYADYLSGNWAEVPDWAIRRINFLERVIETERRQRAPLYEETCPRFKHPSEEMSCFSVKQCYPYLCDCSCGKCNEIWLSDKEITYLVSSYRNRE